MLSIWAFAGTLPHTPIVCQRAGDSTEAVLWRAQRNRSAGEDLSVGEGAAEHDTHASGVAHDDRPDLEQFGAQGARLAASELAAAEPQGAQPLDQHVGEAGEQQAELVGGEVMTRSAIGE